GREVAGHEVDRVGEVLPRAGDAFHLRLAAELAFRAHFAGDAGHFRGEAAELLHHRVHGLGGAEEFAGERAALDFERHGLGQVALGDGADDAGDFAGRVDQVGDQRVDRVDRVGPGGGDL